MIMARLLGLGMIVPLSIILTVSFFVLFALRKVDASGLKAFGFVVAALLWLSALLVFSGGIYTLSTGRCPIMVGICQMKMGMCPMMKGGMMRGMMPSMMEGAMMPGQAPEMKSGMGGKK